VTIDTQSAAPVGAAPVSVSVPGPGARSGDAPSTNDLFAALVAQLSGSEPEAPPSGDPPADMPAAGPGARSGDAPAINTRLVTLVPPLSGSGPAARASVSVAGPDVWSGDAPATNTRLVTRVPPLSGSGPATPAAVPAAGPGVRSGAAPSSIDPGAILSSQGNGSGPAPLLGRSHAVPATPLTLGPFAPVGVVPVIAGHRSGRTSGAPVAGEPDDVDAADDASAADGAPAEMATTFADATPGLTGEVAVPVWIWPHAEPQPLARAAAETGSSGAGQDEGADVSAAATAPLTDEGSRIGRQWVSSGVGTSAGHQTAGARPSTSASPGAEAPPVPPDGASAGSAAAVLSNTPAGASPLAAAPAASSPGASAASSVVPVSINASSAAPRTAAVPSPETGGSDAPAAPPAPAAPSHETGRADAPAVPGAPPAPAAPSHETGRAAAPAAPVSHATPSADAFGAARNANLSSVPSGPPAAVDPAAASAPPVDPDAARAREAVSDRLALLRRAAGGGRIAEPLVTAGPPRPGSVAGIAATDPDGRPGSSAGRRLSDRLTEAFADAPSRDAVAPLDGRPADANAAAPSHAERAALAAGRGLEMAAAGAAAPGGWSAASVQPMVDLQAAAIPDDTDVRRQIVQAVRLQWRDGVGDARLTLQPEHLGDVTIALRVAQGGVSIHVSAETPEVRAWMNANELSLRQGLAQHGLTLDRLIVSDEPADAMPDRDGRRQRAPEEEEPPPAPPRRSETATFEVVV
jgi:hypothetical protein